MATLPLQLPEARGGVLQASLWGQDWAPEGKIHRTVGTPAPCLELGPLEFSLFRLVYMEPPAIQSPTLVLAPVETPVPGTGASLYLPGCLSTVGGVRFPDTPTL